MTDTRTTAQRWADWITEFSGSWGFIGWFAFICVGWIVLNAYMGKPFDAYPYILLNGMLTIISTFQSPVLLMSQNRQNETDKANIHAILTRLDLLQASVDKVNAKEDPMS